MPRSGALQPDSVISLAVTVNDKLVFFLRCQRWAACHPGAPCTGRCRTRACVATASVHPTPARAVPCWTKPCPVTSCSAALRRTTARCHLAWSTTRRRPTCGVSRDQNVWKAGRQRRSCSVIIGGHAAGSSTYFTSRSSCLFCLNSYTGHSVSPSLESKEQNHNLQRERASYSHTSESPRPPPLRDALGLSFLFSGASQDADTCLKSHLCPTSLAHSNKATQSSPLIGLGVLLRRGPPLRLR